MSRARVRNGLLAVSLAAVALGGCGDSRIGKAPSLSRLPLVAGARIDVSVRQCDPGANAYCALEAVVRDTRFRSSRELFDAESALLRSAGWSASNGEIGDEQAAESPGHRLRVTYAPADRDLAGLDLGWIHRAKPIALALSRTLIERAPALSLMLEAGSS